ncbi:MAG: class I SAM-dependent methyltransferase [Candidatus Sericytochromatia bacterium]|nr:class I SAM-dependent methyltransferase [Candidatus Tanganyikabacteria bacterium]
MNPTPWHQDDGFWHGTQAQMFTEQRWEAADGEIEQILTLTGATAPGPILDLCCGPGRHALALARRGFRVTGVDRTGKYLAEAAARAAEASLDVEWIQSDMREFERPGAFHAVINMFTAFGYFADPGDDRRVVENVYRSLVPGGAFLLEMAGKEVIARIFQARSWHEEPDGTLVLEERRVAPGWGWIDNRWIHVKGAERVEFHVGHRLYSAAELTGLLSACGFARTAVFGDLAGAPYDTAARRLVAIGWK